MNTAKCYKTLHNGLNCSSHVLFDTFILLASAGIISRSSSCERSVVSGEVVVVVGGGGGGGGVVVVVVVV